jgi:hypothetical protein
MSALDYAALMRAERKKFREEGSSAAVSAPVATVQTTDTARTITPPTALCIGCGGGGEAIEGLILMPSQPFELAKFKVGEVQNLYYVPDAVTEELEAKLQGLVASVGRERGVWKQLKSRRLQVWGTFPEEMRAGTGTGAGAGAGEQESPLSGPMPLWLEALIDELMRLGVFGLEDRPNNVLVNEYSPHEGILHHTDGPLYFHRVAVLSLGSPCILSLRPNLTPDQIGLQFGGDVASVVLRRRSLFVFEDSAYSAHKHGIEGAPLQRVGEQGPCTNSALANAPDCSEVCMHVCMC